MDIVDVSSTYESALREEAVRLQQERHRAAMSGTSRTHCEDCDEPIPEDRRKAQKGCKRCVPCQDINERPRT